MNIILYILSAIIGGIVLLLFIGLIMPKNRTVKEVVNFSSDLKIVWDVVTNNEDYEWRSDISKIETLDNGKSWIEYPQKGNATTNFKILRKDEAKEYSFSMDNAMFTGHFNSKFESKPEKGVQVEFVENISIKNPIIRPLSYLFFNLKAFQDKYISDLKTKLNELT